jgi:HD-GYP domain-containing protein (c-di-GMP phosphodiesterase class II)
MKPRIKPRFQTAATWATVALVVFLVGAFLASTISRFERVAVETGQGVFDQMVSGDQRTLETLFHGAGRVVASYGTALDPGDFRAGDGSISEYLGSSLRATIAANPTLYGLYFGLGNGDFLQVIGVRQSTAVQTFLEAPTGTEFAERLISRGPEGPIERWRFLDDAGVPLAQRTGPARYDPTERLWYREAVLVPGLVITSPYLFSSSGELGVTFAQRVQGSDAVVGADLSLVGLSQVVTESLADKPGALLVLDGRGRLLALADSAPVADAPVPALLSGLDESGRADLEALAGHLADGASAFSGAVDLLGEPHLLAVRTVEVVPGRHYPVLGFAPLAAFTEQVVRARNDVLLIALLVLMATLPAVYVVARRSSVTLSRLSHDAERVQAMDFSGDPDVGSVFYEIDTLGAAHRTMKYSIRERTAALALAQDKLRSLVESGLAMASERDRSALLRTILMSGKRLSTADAATLFLTTEQRTLRFALRSREDDLPAFEIQMYDPETGAPQEQYASVYAVLHRKTVIIDDVYSETRFDLAGARRFDSETGYRSVSMLNAPLVAVTGEVLGVLQLINATEPETGQVVPFDPEVVGFVEALAAQAAMAIDNQNLVESQRALMDSLIQIIAGAIDAKSAYTGGHCERVPELALMLAEEACKVDHGPLADFRFETDDEWREFRIGAWLHDCGKVTTPEYVVDKATKLETIFNRIHEIRTRFEVLLRDAEIQRLQSLLDGGDPEVARAAFEARREQLVSDYAFIAECNLGGEFMNDDQIERIHRIAGQTWLRHFDDRLGLSHEEQQRYAQEPVAELPAVEHLLADRPHHRVPRTGDRAYDERFGFNVKIPALQYNFGEVYNLCVRRGTLSEEERFKINEHIIQTILMLDRLPFPKHLRRIPEYAGTHHETLIGTGYPRKLTAEELSVPARIMAIADIFEALTASDRPYKKAKTLSEAIRILSFFRKDQHIDADLFELFLKSGVYRRFAERYLAPEQMDEVEVEAYLS